MSTLYKCDRKDCQYIGKEVLNAKIFFERTPEEIDKLFEAEKIKNPSIKKDFVRAKYVVSVDVELCREHYNELKDLYFNK
jgi:hypothetical protein